MTAIDYDIAREELLSLGWTVFNGGCPENGYWVQVRRDGCIRHCEQATPALAIAEAMERIKQSTERSVLGKIGATK